MSDSLSRMVVSGMPVFLWQSELPPHCSIPVPHLLLYVDLLSW